MPYLDEFGPQVSSNNGELPGFEHRLVDVELIGIDGTLYDRFSDSVRRGDKHGVSEATLGVQREDDAGSSKIRPNHLLNARRESDVAVAKPFVDPVPAHTNAREHRAHPPLTSMSCTNAMAWRQMECSQRQSGCPYARNGSIVVE